MESTMKRGRIPTSSPDKPKEKAVRLDICVSCQKSVDDDYITCHWCSQWEHRTCANIKQSESVMLNSPSENIFFLCSSCIMNLPLALSSFTNQSELKEEIEAKLQSVEDKLSDKIINIETKLQSQLDEFCIQPIKNKLSDKIATIETKLQDYHKAILGAQDTSKGSFNNQRLPCSPMSDDSVANITLSLSSEQKEKEKRQFNIIVRNLKESDATNSTTRKQEDIESCQSLFSTYLNVTASIKNAIYLGKRESKPCRLLKLTIDTLDEKTKILKYKLKLKNEQNPQHVRKIFISPELTPLEQRKNNALRQKLVDMNKIQNIYTIRNGQIVRKHVSNASTNSVTPSVSVPNGDGSRTAS